MTDIPAPAASAAKAIAGALIRHALTAAGTAIVARGVIDQQTADGITGAAGDYVLGAGLALASAGWGVLRARAVHWRWVQAWIAPAKPLPPA